MSVKRDYEDVDGGEIPEPTTKRAKSQKPKSRQHQNASIDPTWGQKYVFSSYHDATTIPPGEESDFEDDADAMAYLMSVRHEAGGIPHTLVAPKVQIGPKVPVGFRKRQRSADDEDAEDGEISEDEDDDEVNMDIYTNGLGDTRGYYADGAYVGVAEDEEQAAEEGEASDQEDEPATEKAIHDAYFTALLSRYTHLRALLHASPPADAAPLSAAHPTHVAPFTRKTSPAAVWSRHLRTTDPHPLQLAAMDKTSVLRLLQIVLGGKFLRQGYALPERTSRWLWALLARLPDRGELNHADIAWVRDLGRRAVLLGRSLAEMAALRDELAEGGLGVHEGVDGSSSGEDMAEGEAVEDDEEIDGQTDGPAEPADPQPDTEGLAEAAEEAPSEDVAMEMASDSDVEEGEASEHDEPNLEDVKARLLAQLEEDPERAEEAMARARINMRATLNMILTVAGEFYGQRDLLEFREPFVAM